MSISAVICATLPSADSPSLSRAQIAFAGQTVLEYQARQLKEAGIDQVIALVDAVTPTLSRTVDRLTGEGIRMRLIRDMPTLMRDVPRDGDLVLVADGFIVDQRHVDALVNAQGNALLVVEDSEITGHLERIDGMHRWCGLAKIAQETLFGTLDLIGDWDFALTLLRAGVQGNARRITVPTADLLEGRAACIDRQATANLVAQALLTPTDNGAAREGGAEHYLLSPLARLLSARLIRMQVPVAQVRGGAAGLALLALLTLYPGWSVLALLLLLIALVAQVAADQLAAMGRRRVADGWVDLAPTALVLAVMALTGIGQGYWEALYLAALSGVVHLAVRRGAGGVLSPWALLTPGTALLLMLLGTIVGAVGTVLTLAVLGAIASVGAMLLRGRE